MPMTLSIAPKNNHTHHRRSLKRLLLRSFFALLVVSGINAHAQPLQLDMDVFAARRAAFMDKMDPSGIAIFPSKPVYVRNGDITYGYRQESNFYYLSGFEEPDAILLLAPSNDKYKFVMFIGKPDPQRDIVEGPRTGVEGAMGTFRADTALYYDDFEISVYQFIKREGVFYYPFGINPEIDEKVQKRFTNDYWHTTNPFPMLSEMRLIKQDADWRMGFRQAIDISVKAHVEAIKSIRPGMYEYEIQGIFEHIYRKNGSPRNAYPCIIASGPNSCTLHYSKNTRRMNDGELVLMDCAAEYGYYAADITRTVPVNGTFSKEERTIYQIALDAQDAAMKTVRPGVQFRALSDVIDSVLSNRLAELGFLKQKRDLSMFTLHRYTHWLGLDVHDVGEYTTNGESRVLEPGMVFAIEPGIYIRSDIFDRLKGKGYTDYDLEMLRPILQPYVNIGVRIEDDVAVTNDGFINLSAGAPRGIDEIENLMRREER
ncbi:MAG: aminopeptidase P N-terminal domain-containing protein [Bacteroidota bacterium]